MLASIDNTTSVVSITTDLMRAVSVVEYQPEIQQTARACWEISLEF